MSGNSYTVALRGETRITILTRRCAQRLVDFRETALYEKQDLLQTEDIYCLTYTIMDS